MRNTESNSWACTRAPRQWHHMPGSGVQMVHELQQACGHDHVHVVVTPPAFSSYYLRYYCTLLNPSVSTLGFFADHLHRHVRRWQSSSTNTQKYADSMASSCSVHTCTHAMPQTLCRWAGQLLSQNLTLPPQHLSFFLIAAQKKKILEEKYLAFLLGKTIKGQERPHIRTQRITVY